MSFVWLVMHLIPLLSQLYLVSLLLVIEVGAEAERGEGGHLPPLTPKICMYM